MSSFDADPAAVIHDPLTKLGLQAGEINLESLQAASLTLFDEAHGQPRAIERSDSIIADIVLAIDRLRST